MRKLFTETWKDAVFPYLVYVLFFLGMGLTSGAIVHMPIDPTRYSVVLGIGMVMFVVASLLNETVIDKKELTLLGKVRLVFFSLMLTVGIGMISGGIQHFEDVLDSAGLLIPAGIALSFIGYLCRYRVRLEMRKALPLFASVAAGVVALSFALQSVAGSMPRGGVHSHGHGDEEEAIAVEAADHAAGAADDAVAHAAESYFTANEDGTITKVDAATNRIVATMKTKGAIHNVQISPDNRILAATLVPGTAAHDDHGDSHGHGYAVFFDAEMGALLRKVSVGDHPAHVVFTPDGKLALVTDSENDSVSVINTATYQVARTVKTDKGPHGFRISADGRYAYIANSGSDTVSVIDIAKGTESQRITVGKAPVTTAITGSGDTLLVTLGAENALALVDLPSGRISKVGVGNGPAQVYVQKDGRYAFVANQGTKASPSASLSKVDMATGTVAATIKVGNGAHGIVATDNNRYVYVTNQYDDTVSVIDNAKNRVIAIIPVGKAPNGITYRG